ncbi:MAG: hypothetical protein KDA79_03835 [Planctomycetaceae bacterium]|nr:hypothetical protein [Planctomycetaceae bacterium]
MLVAVYLLATTGLPLASSFVGVTMRCGCSLTMQQEKNCCCCEGESESGAPPRVKACCRKSLQLASAAADESAGATAEPGREDRTHGCCRSPLGFAAVSDGNLTDAAEQPVHAELRSCGCQMRPFGEIGLNAEPRLAGTRIQLTVLPICCRLHAEATLFPSRSIAPETPPPRV